MLDVLHRQHRPHLLTVLDLLALEESVVDRDRGSPLIIPVKPLLRVRGIEAPAPHAVRVPVPVRDMDRVVLVNLRLGGLPGRLDSARRASFLLELLLVLLLTPPIICMLHVLITSCMFLSLCPHLTSTAQWHHISGTYRFVCGATLTQRPCRVKPVTSMSVVFCLRAVVAVGGFGGPLTHKSTTYTLPRFVILVTCLVLWLAMCGLFGDMCTVSPAAVILETDIKALVTLRTYRFTFLVCPSAVFTDKVFSP